MKKTKSQLLASLNPTGKMLRLKKKKKETNHYNLDIKHTLLRGKTVYRWDDEEYLTQPNLFHITL